MEAVDLMISALAIGCAVGMVGRLLGLAIRSLTGERR